LLVSITKVEIETAPKGYKVATVNYLKDGKEELRKIMSFAAPKAFEVLAGLTDFPVDANITLEKKGQYWNWTGVEVGGKASAPQAKASTGKVIGSNYETPAERARRQVYIVRQSSVASAIEYFKGRDPKGIQVNPQEVIDTAKVFEQYIFDLGQAVGEPE
jgi:hypothetical protein